MSTAARARAKTPDVIAETCIMGPRMPAQRAPSTTKRAPAGVDPRRRDALTASVAIAHDDSEARQTDAQVGARHGLEARTVNDWRRTGPPEARAFASFLFESSDPYRWIASMKALAKQKVFRARSDEQLIDRFHELRGHEKRLEGVDNGQDLTPGLSWIDRAAAKERDAAVDEEISALMREFAARGISEARVFGRGW